MGIVGFRSGYDIFHQMSVDAGQAKIPPLVATDQFAVVDSEPVQDRDIQIVDMQRAGLPLFLDALAQTQFPRWQ